MINNKIARLPSKGEIRFITGNSSNTLFTQTIAKNNNNSKFQVKRKSLLSLTQANSKLPKPVNSHIEIQILNKVLMSQNDVETIKKFSPKRTITHEIVLERPTTIRITKLRRNSRNILSSESKINENKCSSESGIESNDNLVTIDTLSKSKKKGNFGFNSSDYGSGLKEKLKQSIKQGNQINMKIQKQENFEKLNIDEEKEFLSLFNTLNKFF